QPPGPSNLSTRCPHTRRDHIEACRPREAPLRPAPQGLVTRTQCRWPPGRPRTRVRTASGLIQNPRVPTNLSSRRSASLVVPATLVPSRRWGGIRPNRPSVRGSRLARLARPAPRVDADVPARVYPLPIHHRPLIQFAEQLPLLNLVKLINVSL